MKDPLVSVVMPVFNGERFLKEATDSILNQTYARFEFIIIDDGSVDKSSEILSSYQLADRRVKVYSQENCGVTSSLNRGCSLASGKYIVRMDADDISLQDRLALQVQFMEDHPHVGVLGGGVEFIDGLGKTIETHVNPAENSDIQEALLHGCALWHPTVIMRKDVFTAMGGYRQIAVGAEDYDLWLRIAEHFQLGNLETVLLKYRLHSFQVSVRMRRQQTTTSFAARSAALSRRSGQPDPLESVKEITPQLVASLGFSEAVQQTMLGREALRWARYLVRIGEFSRALEVIEEALMCCRPRQGKRWVIADLHLMAARLYWRKGQIARSGFAGSCAVVIRPTILARPLKEGLEAMWQSKLPTLAVKSGSSTKRDSDPA